MTTSTQPQQPSLNNSSSSSLPPSRTLAIRSYSSLPLRVSLSFPPEGRTKQSFKDECDINRIMARFQKTGVLEHLAQRPPQYLDCSAFDFQVAMDIVAQSKALFAGLPSEVRDRFANDPGRFLAFMEDPANDSEAVKMGLRKPPVNDLNPQAAPLPAASAPAPAAATEAAKASAV